MAVQITAGNLSWGAGLDNFQSKTILVQQIDGVNTSGGVGTRAGVMDKGDGNLIHMTGWFSVRETSAASTGHQRFDQDFSTVQGSWVSANSTYPPSEYHQWGLVYDRGATGNTPTMYKDGASLAVTNTTPPVGNSTNDNTHNLDVPGAVGGDQNIVGWIIYDNTLFTAAMVNRHRWWGMAPGGCGSTQVWLPLWTSDTVNKGSSTVTITTSVGPGPVPFPRGVQRPGTGGGL